MSVAKLSVIMSHSKMLNINDLNSGGKPLELNVNELNNLNNSKNKMSAKDKVKVCLSVFKLRFFQSLEVKVFQVHTRHKRLTETYLC